MHASLCFNCLIENVESQILSLETIWNDSPFKLSRLSWQLTLLVTRWITRIYTIFGSRMMRSIICESMPSDSCHGEPTCIARNCTAQLVDDSWIRYFSEKNWDVMFEHFAVFGNGLNLYYRARCSVLRRAFKQRGPGKTRKNGGPRVDAL